VIDLLRWTRNRFGARQARHYREVILQAIDELEFGPDVPGGLARDDIAPGIKTLHVARRGRRGRHVIVYRVLEADSIEILRVLHDAMDIPRQLEDLYGDV
jgi:toxin ParE1/3/4